MDNLWIKAISSELFWDALSSIATLLGLLVALFLPFISNYNKYNRIEKLIKAELDHNYLIIRNMRSLDTVTIPKPPGKAPIAIDPASRNESYRQHIELRIWRQYRYELASARLNKFEKFQSVNKLVEYIVDQFEKPNFPPGAIAIMQADAAKSFVEIYKELWPPKSSLLNWNMDALVLDRSSKKQSSPG
ncbi:MAG: hypothetical protein AB4050_18720 [Synechococcus sp.]